MKLKIKFIVIDLNVASKEFLRVLSEIQNGIIIPVCTLKLLILMLKIFKITSISRKV